MLYVLGHYILHVISQVRENVEGEIILEIYFYDFNMKTPL